MKTNKEILDFFGVEVGKKYIITKDLWGFHKGDIITIKQDGDEVYPCLDRDKDTGKMWFQSLLYLDYKELKEVLDEKETEYLRAVIKPFREKIISIIKCKSAVTEYEYINIEVTKFDDSGCVDNCTFPYFAQGTMYKKMEADKKYTLEELGL